MTDYRLVYYSENRVPSSQLSAEIETILAASRRNNVLVGITGALMFSGGHFAQVLEGSQAAIESTFERIQQDRRHGNVNLLEFSSAPTRGFQNWSMAFIGSSDDVTAEVKDIAIRSGFDPRPLDGGQLFVRLLELLKEPVSRKS